MDGWDVWVEHCASHWLPRCLGLDTQVRELQHPLPCPIVSGGSPLQWCRWKALPHPEPQQAINPLFDFYSSSIHPSPCPFSLLLGKCRPSADHKRVGHGSGPASRSCVPRRQEVSQGHCPRTQRLSPCQLMAKVLDETVARLQRVGSQEGQPGVALGPGMTPGV